MKCKNEKKKISFDFASKVAATSSQKKKLMGL